MDLSSLPIAALPLPAPGPAAPAAAAASGGPRLPLARRFTLAPTITAKANYYDLAQTRRPPYDLRTSLIWLCLCAHDNSVWWQPRSPEHRDGEDDPPLPLALSFGEWMQYIQQWQIDNFDPDEEQEIEALAIRVWIGSHATACVPEDDGGPDAKKNASRSSLTGPSSTPTPSEAAHPPGESTSSSACPSEPSTPSFTPGSSPRASTASAPQPPP